MPQLGMTMETGTIIEWNYREGDQINRGNVLFEVETDKATLEVEAVDSGCLIKITANNGETVPVLTPVGYLGAENEEYMAATPQQPQSADMQAVPVQAHSAVREAAAPERDGAPRTTPRARTLAAESGVKIGDVPRSADGVIRERDVEVYLAANRVRTTPVAVKASRALGVDLPSLGISGRVYRKDVEAATASASAPEYLPRTAVQTRAAAAVMNAWNTIPMVTNCIELDMTEALRLCETLNTRYSKQGVKINLTDLMIKVLGYAMKHDPDANVRYEGGKLRVLQTMHIGMACATPNGLVVPVLRDVPDKGIIEVSREKTELADRARNGKLLPQDLGGASTTLSNMGGYRAEMFTPIINAPESCIFGTGAVKEKAVVMGGEICIRPMMWLNFTYDHRILDGESAAHLLNTVKDVTELPSLFVGYEGVVG